MESKLTLNNILFAYNTLKKNHDRLSSFDIGKHYGYLEAGLQNFGYLETIKNSNGDFQYKREMVKSKKWWKKDKLETIEQTIIRQVENMFKQNNIQF